MKKVKCGMKVYIREDLEPGVNYGGEVWDSKMERGNWVIVNDVSDNIVWGQVFFIKHDPYTYTTEMVDWDKTLPLSTEDLTPKEDYKIKFVLKRYDNYLVFQVIQQCDSITAKNIYKESLLKFTASNGFEIWSTNNPYIAKDYLCIGGSVSKTGTTVGEFKSSSEAKEVMETAIKALAEWKANKYFTQANEVEEIEIASDGYYEL